LMAPDFAEYVGGVNTTVTGAAAARFLDGRATAGQQAQDRNVV
jgi:hypothetical protein